MKYDSSNRTFDCAPTLTDSQVLEFCRLGYLIIDGVVPDEVNQRTCDYLNGKLPSNPSYIPEGFTRERVDSMQTSNEPSSLLLEDWFNENVIMNSELAGALRSLLGRDVGLPVIVSRHSVETPSPAQGWHHDADRVFGPELRYLEVFYYPQDTPDEMGPTEVVPSSHIFRVNRDENDSGVLTAASAGSFVIHSQSILHRRGSSTSKGLRHMLKYDYWRTVLPEKDWITEPEFDPHDADYGPHEINRYVAHMFSWLCGKGEEFRLIGGQAWPWNHPNKIGPSYGFGSTEGYVPDWRREGHDGYAHPR